MASELNFFDTYVLMAITEEIVPQQTFFKDRYFPTGEGDIFACDKVLTEYRKGDRKMAAFVSARAGDIPMDRRGYEIHEYQPAFIAPSRLLTLDELRKRGFGEAIYANSTPAQRAARHPPPPAVGEQQADFLRCRQVCRLRAHKEGGNLKWPMCQSRKT